VVHDVPTSVFTVDVEEWYHANYSGAPSIVASDESVVAQTRRLLEILAENEAKGTFFVLGETAARHRGLIAEIADAGHEVACHSFTHDLVSAMAREEFADQARRAKGLLEEITGREIVGFRAPSWSVGASTPWFWEELAVAGFRYSSSLFPFTTFLYGDSEAPRFANQRAGIWEIPPTTASVFGRRVPFSGGFYLRVFPAAVIGHLARRVGRERASVNYYVHPREIDPSSPRLELGMVHRAIHYYGLKGVPGKLRRILSSGSFEPMDRLCRRLERRSSEG
jgi:polysaccharide deacetylase family protein (PEP-CTERM system associated)